MKVLRLARPGAALLVSVLLCWATASPAEKDTASPAEQDAAAAAQQDAAVATRQYNTAVGLHNSEAYDLAAEEWLKLINDFAGDSRLDRAHHYLGVCYSKQGQLDKAVETFQKVVRDYPEFKLLADTYLNLGLTQYNIAHSGKAAVYDAAAKTFDTLATKYPTGKHLAQALYYHGDCLYNRGKVQEAAEKFGQVVDQHADHAMAAEALFALGVAQADLKDHETALQTYDRFLKKYPENTQVASVTMWRGESLFALKQHAPAAEAYAAAAEAFVAAAKTPGFGMADYATLRRAESLAALKQYAEAAALYASVPEKFEGSQYVAFCQLEAGKKYFAAGEFAKALEYLDKVLAAGGESAADAAHWAARSLLKQKRPAEALEVVQKVLPDAAGGPLEAHLLMDQADAIYEIPQRRGESVALYASLAKNMSKDPLAADALYMAAYAAMGQGDYATAVAHAEAFQASHASHDLEVGVMHVLAESNLLLKQYAEAEKLYDQLLKKAPDDDDAEIWKVHRGTAVYLQKNYQGAIAVLKPVIGQIEDPELAAAGWYRIGRSQVTLKQFPAAVESLQSSLAAQPKWNLADDTRLALAYALQRTGELQKARQQAQTVIDEFPDSKMLDEAHFRLGECNRLDGQLKPALQHYQKIVDQRPQSRLIRLAFYGIGWAKLRLQDYAGAEEAFSTLAQQYPDDKLIPRARYGRGMARQQLKKYPPAIEDLQAMLAADPLPEERSRARHVVGLCHKGLEQFDRAAATFEKLLADDPQYADKADVYFELGWAQKSLHKEADAAATFTRLTEEFPDGPLAADSHCLIGDYAYQAKDYKKAAAAYYAAMEKAGKTKLGEEAAYRLGLSYYLQEELDKAQKMFHYQRDNWPQGPLVSDAAYMEAECFLKQKEFKEAAALYPQVKDPAGKDVDVLTLLHWADAAGQLKQWDKSLELATQCIEQFSDSSYLSQALYLQGWAQQNLGKRAPALAAYEQVIAKSSGELAARAQFMIGEIQFQQKQHAEAIKSYYKVIYGYGYPKWQADATFEAARCFETLKKIPQARKLYETLVEKYPDSDKVSTAKERIEALQ